LFNRFKNLDYHSTIDALTKTHDYIIEELRQNKKVIGIFLDLSKAFDSIDNKILVDKLNRYGIRGPYNDLIKSYVSHRKCFTLVKENASDIREIEFGVPQGSILGPILFTLYINDIKSLSNKADINLFADDTNLFCSDLNYNLLVQKCNTALKESDAWLKCNKLTLNTEKTHLVDFSKKK